MSPKIQKIINKYPHLYKDGKVRSGFDIGDGWINLVDTLSAVLEEEIKNMPEEIQAHFFAAQVKEKFGTLRFYVNSSTPFIEGAISVAESMSGHTCEVCGQPGELRQRSWLKTLCDKCNEK